MRMLLPTLLVLILTAPLGAQTVDEWIAAVAELDGDARAKADWLLEKLGSGSRRQSVPSAMLDRCAFDWKYGWYGVRDAAALALARTNRAAAVERLQDPHRAVRQSVAQAIAGVVLPVHKPRPPGSVIVLTTPIPDSEVLAAAGLAGQPTIDDCLDALRSDNESRRAVAFALLELPWVRPAKPERLRAAFKSDNVCERCGAAMASADLSQLVQALKDEDLRVRRAAARSLMKTHPRPLGLVVELLRDPDAVVAFHAAESLRYQKLEPEQRQALLDTATKRPEPLVRGAAILSLPLPPPAVFAALEDPSTYVRWAAVHALPSGREQARAALARITPMLDDDDAFLRYLALLAVERLDETVLSPFKDSIVPALRRALTARVPAERSAALGAARRLGIVAAPLVPELRLILARDKWGIRLRAAEALGATKSAAATTALVAAVDEGPEQFRRSVVTAMGHLGEAGVGAVEKLLSLLDDKALFPYQVSRFAGGTFSTRPRPRSDPFEAVNRGFRGVVPSAIVKIGKPAVPILVRALKEAAEDRKIEAVPSLIPDEDREIQIVKMLAAIGPGAAEAVGIVASFLDSPSERLRTNAIRALGAIGSTEASVVPKLRAVLLDEPYLTLVHDGRDGLGGGFQTADERTLAARALVALDRQTVNDALLHAYPAIRLAAARALSGAMAGMYTTAGFSGEGDPHTARKEAIAAAGFPSDIDHFGLIAMLGSPNENERAAAFAFLSANPDRKPLRKDPKKAANATLRALLDADPNVRWGGTASLAHGIGEGMNAQELIGRMLSDKDDRVKLAAIDAFRRLHARAPDTVRRGLESLLDHPDVSLAGGAALALAFSPYLTPQPSGVQAADWMRKRPHPLTYAAAARVAGRARQENAPIRDVALESLGSQDVSLRVLSLWILARTGAPASATQAMIDAARRDRVVDRKLLAEALTAMEQVPDEALPLLREMAAEDSAAGEAAQLAVLAHASQTRNLDVLSAAVRSPNRTVRLTAIRFLSNQGEEALPLLVPALADEDSSLCHLACEAFVRVGKARPLIDVILGEAPSAAKGSAFQSLAKVYARHRRQRPAVDDALPTLLEIVERSEDPAVLKHAPWFFATLGERGKIAVPWLQRLIKAKDFAVQSAARHVLRTMGVDLYTFDEAIALLANPPRGLENDLLAVIEKRPKEAARAIPALLAFSKQRPGLSTRLAGLFERMGPEAREAVPFLIELLETGPRAMASPQAAARALAAIGPAAWAALPALEKRLEDFDPRLEVEALKAIGAITRDSAESMPLLIKAMRGSDRGLRLTAMTILESLGTKAEAAVPELERALSDPDDTIRRRAAQTLAAVKPREPTVAEEKKPAMTDAARRRLAAALARAAQLAAGDSSAIPDIVPAKAALLATRSLELADSRAMRGLALASAARALWMRWDTPAGSFPFQGQWLQFLPDSKRLAGMVSGAVRIWNLESGREESRIVTGRASSFVLSPRGDVFALLFRDRTGIVEVRDVATGERCGKIELPEGGIQGVSFSRDGSRLAVMSAWVLRVFDVATCSQQTIVRLEEHYQRHFSFLAYAGNDRVVTRGVGGSGYEVCIWEAATGRLLHRVDGGRQGLAFVASPDGRYVASSTIGSLLFIWETATGKPALETELDKGAGALAFHPRDNRLFFSSGRKIAVLRVGSRNVGSTDIRCGGRDALSVSPDGRTLVTGDWRGVSVWDVERGALRAELTGHRFFVHAVAYTADGKSVVSTGNDGTVRIWDADDGTPKQVLRPTPEGHDPLPALAMHRDGRQFATGSDGGWVRLWRAKNGAFEQVKQVQLPGVRSLAYTPDGTTLLAGTAGGEILILDPETLQKRGGLAGHTGEVWALAFSPDGRTLASGAWDRTVRLWDLERRVETARLEGDGDHVMGVAFHPGGKLLATNGYDFTVRLWEVKSGRLVREMRCETPPPGERKEYFDRREWPRHRSGLTLPRVEFSPDGRTLAAAFHDGILRFYDHERGTLVTGLPVEERTLCSFAFSPDGTSIATGGRSGSVSVWDATPLQHRAVLRGHGASVTDVAFTPEGRLVTSSRDGTVRVWDATRGIVERVLGAHKGPVLAVATNPGNETFASGGEDGKVLVWHPDSDEPTSRAAMEDVVQALAFQPDGKRVAIGLRQKSIRVMDPATGKLDPAWPRATPHANAIAYAPTGRLLAAGLQGNSIPLFQIPEGRVFRGVSGHGFAVYDVAFSPDGRHLATTGDDRLVRVYGMNDLLERFRLEGHGDRVNALAFSPDAAILASGDDSGDVRLWSMTTGETVAVFRAATRISALGYHPGGTLLAAGASDGTIRLWNVDRDLLTGDVARFRARLEVSSGLRLRGDCVVFPSVPMFFHAKPPYRLEDSPRLPVRVLGGER